MRPAFFVALILASLLLTFPGLAGAQQLPPDTLLYDAFRDNRDNK